MKALRDRLGLERKIVMIRAFFLLICLLSSFVFGQNTVPDTDIFLVEIKNNEGKIEFGSPISITQRTGYDNQPSFLPDGKSLFYTSIREDGQADVYRYEIESKTTTRVTKTAESEYSPTLMADGKHFSVVRVESDGKTQRLWKFPVEDGNPSLVLESVTAVGYYAWYDANTLALFIVGEPHTLQIASLTGGTRKVIVSDIGRALHRIPGRNAISFVHKISDSSWVMKQLDVTSGEIGTIISTLPGSEDCTWTPDGKLWMGNNGKLYQYDPKGDKDWQEIADFSQTEIKVLGRLAINPQADRLAVVAVRNR
jgi:hypothetical protein